MIEGSHYLHVMSFSMIQISFLNKLKLPYFFIFPHASPKSLEYTRKSFNPMLLNKTVSLESSVLSNGVRDYYDNLEKTGEERVTAYFYVESY